MNGSHDELEHLLPGQLEVDINPGLGFPLFDHLAQFMHAPGRHYLFALKDLFLQIVAHKYFLTRNLEVGIGQL